MGSAPVRSPRPRRNTPRRSSVAVWRIATREVGVVDPVDGYLVDAQPRPLGEHEQLGVEEPRVVLDEGEQYRSKVGAQGLEAALGVRETGGQRAWSSRL